MSEWRRGLRALDIQQFILDILCIDPRCARQGVAPMNTIDADSGVPLRPRLRSVFRLQWEAAQHAYVLLYPEGMVKLNTSAGAILARCDGEHELDDIIGELERLFGTAELAPDVYRFLDHARLRGWLD